MRESSVSEEVESSYPRKILNGGIDLADLLDERYLKVKVQDLLQPF